MSSAKDFIAVKKGYCKICLEKKLNCKILRSMEFDPHVFMEWKRELKFEGIAVKCECNNI